MNDKKIRLTLCYDGREFHGWQVQKDLPTVQGELCSALEKLTGQKISVTGCSRTDAGVHALEYVCHTDFFPIPCENIPYALNSKLPSAITVREARIEDRDFHARYSCLGKEYVYKIYNDRFMDPFLVDRAMFYPGVIDTDALGFVGEEIVGTHDFSSFMAQGSPVESTIRTVKWCNISRDENLVTVKVAADGFLYNMVRIIVGTFITAGRDGMKRGEITEIINSCDRTRAGFTAPACGLYLNKVFY